MPTSTSEIRKMILKKRKDVPEKVKEFVSTGSTQLDLAISGKLRKGFQKGKYVLIVGDSESAKTFFSMTCLAEAAKNPAFDDYLFVHDDPEDGASMDKAQFFGEGVADRIQPPSGDWDDPGHSETVEDMYESIARYQKEGKPFIYIVDSENALSARAVLRRHEDNAEAHAAGTKEDESYGTEKAKVHSDRLRITRNRLRKTGSILIIISQTRDVLGAKPFQETKTRSGGRALKFFADVEIWTSIKGQMKKKVKGKDRNIGSVIQIRVRKNRETGKHRSVDVPFREGYGIDDTRGCVDYLIEEGNWKGSENKIEKCPPFNFSGPKDEFIAWLEEKGKLGKLRKLVAQTWREIESELAPNRKPRYS